MTTKFKHPLAVSLALVLLVLGASSSGAQQNAPAPPVPPPPPVTDPAPSPGVGSAPQPVPPPVTAHPDVSDSNAPPLVPPPTASNAVAPLPPIDPAAPPNPPAVGAAPPVQQPPQNWSPAMAAYVEKWGSFVKRTGIDQLIDGHLVVPSCEGCVAYLIGCREAVASAADLRGKRIRVSSATKQWAAQVGGIPVLMPGGEIAGALRNDQIDCYVAGGVPVR